MQISDKTKKIFKPIVLICILLVAELMLTLALEPISYTNYFNHDLKVIEDSDANVEMIFIGASRVYRSFVPQIFEEKLEMDTVINAGSSSQRISGSYFQLIELLSRFEPSYVVLGVTGDALWESGNTQADLIVLDRLHGANKPAYIFDVFKPSDYPYAFLKSYRFRNYLGFGSIINNIKSKSDIIIDNYKDNSNDSEYYCDTGFVYSNVGYTAGNFKIEHPIKQTNEMNYDELCYLDKIVELCESKGITLYLVTGPTTMMRIYNSPAYKEAHNWYVNYAEEHNLIYRNLNLLKNRESLLPDTMMHDYNHVNGEGATITSELYADILRLDINNQSADDYFYASFDELRSNVNRVVAVEADIVEKGNTLVITADSLQSEHVVPSYCVLVADSAGEYVPVVDWTQDTVFAIEKPKDTDFSVMIRAKTGTPDEVEAFQCYYFNQ